MNAGNSTNRHGGFAHKAMAVALATALMGGCTALTQDSRHAANMPHQPIVKPLPLMTTGLDNAQAYYTLGKYHYFQGNFARAEQAYLRAVELDPNDPEPHNGLGVLYDRLGRFDEAQAAYRAAIEKAPQAAHILANLGYSLLLAGHPEEAVAPLRQAIALDPGNARAADHLAQAEAGVPASVALIGPATLPEPLIAMPLAEGLRAAGTVAPTTVREDPSESRPMSLQQIPRQSLTGIIRSIVPSSEPVPVADGPAKPPMVANVVGAELRQPVSVATALEGLRVEVSNGNGVTGMARAMRTQWRGEGLNVTRVTNARPFNKQQTVVVCDPALRDRVASLTQLLPIAPRFVAHSTAERRVDVRVILGADSVPAGRRSVELQRLTMLDR